MNGPDQRAEQIFAAALEISDPAERLTYVERICAGDAGLRSEVESLLRAHEQAGEFLKTNPLEDETALGPAGPFLPVTEISGTRIGRYKLLEQIGEGGFGVVWMAEQEEPVRRRVALKIIKLGMDTREVVARFEAERQALALMDHPNIARVFDGGATDSGRPYFVMELVRGEPITKYCDDQRLSLEERLELFMQVCQAVQHAHQKGVIHRDIKPSNILVAIHDDKPVPKVIDFGIAKATQQRLTEKTLFTRFNQFIGTPAYMSPEQAGLSGLDVDTRSDIYSLGVFLYELLTGRTPFSKEELLAGGYEEICRIIREKEPPKPSTRLSTMSAADRSTIAAQRKIPPEKLRRLVRGELDWVVMKCLEKDRARRYATANSLAMDVRRYLANEAVLARPPSAAYQAGKFVRRNRAMVAAAAAIAAVLVLGIAASTWLAVRATQAESEQRRLRQAAQAAQQNEVLQREQARELAQKEKQERERAEDALARLSLQNAEELFASGRSASAIARLATLVRQNPTNRVAAERLMSALANRNFAIPKIKPLGHNEVILSVRFSPDGHRLLTASADQTAQIWSVETGEPISKAMVHRGAVACAQFSADGMKIVTASHDGTASIWETATGTLLIGPIQQNAPVRYAEFSPDAKRVATTTTRTAQVWDTESGRWLVGPLENEKGFELARFSPDGKKLLTIPVGNRKASIWDVVTGKLLAESPEHDGNVWYGEFSQDGSQVATASNEAAAQVWDATTGQPITGPLVHRFELRPCARFSPDGRKLVTISMDGTGLIWDLRTRKPLTEPLRHMHDICTADFSSDGRLVATGSFDKSLRVWDALTGRPACEPIQHSTQVGFTQFSPSSHLLVSIAAIASPSFPKRNLSREAWVWDIRPGRQLPCTLTTDSLRRLEGVIWEGWRVVTMTPTTAEIWDLSRPKNPPVTIDLVGKANTARLGPNGLQIAIGSAGRGVQIWDAQTGKPIPGECELTGPLPWGITDIDFSADGEWLVAGSWNHQARIWATKTGSPRTEPLQHEAPVTFVKFSPDGHLVLTGSWDGTARLWDAHTGRPTCQPLRHHGDVLSVNFSPDGRRVVTGSYDQTARVWETATGQPVIEPVRHSSMIHHVEFSPDGQRLVTASEDFTARIWDARSGRPLTPPLEHQNNVRFARFSPDGLRLVTCSADRTARVWDVHTGLPLSELLVHGRPVFDAQFSPDGRWILTYDTADYKEGGAIISPDKGMYILGGFSAGMARLWEIPVATGPAPSWLADLAEALVGQQLDSERGTKAVSPSELRALQEQLTGISEKGGYTRWARRFFADRNKRPDSPERLKDF